MCEPIAHTEVGAASAETDLLSGRDSSRDSKFSKSRGAFAEVPYFLSKYNPDALRQPAPLLKKLDESAIEEEYARLEG